MKIRLIATTACALIAGCGDGTPDTASAHATSESRTATQRETGQFDHLLNPADDMAADSTVIPIQPGKVQSSALDREAQELEAAQRAAEAARRARMESENRVRENLARLERERLAKRKAGGNSPQPLSVGQDDG